MSRSAALGLMVLSYFLGAIGGSLAVIWCVACLQETDRATADD